MLTITLSLTFIPAIVNSDSRKTRVKSTMREIERGGAKKGILERSGGWGGRGERG